MNSKEVEVQTWGQCREWQALQFWESWKFQLFGCNTDGQRQGRNRYSRKNNKGHKMYGGFGADTKSQEHIKENNDNKTSSPLWQ